MFYPGRKEGTMKKNKKEWTSSRSKKLEECCNDIFYTFETPCGGGEVPYMSATEFIDSISPWETLFDEIESQDIEPLKKILKDDDEGIFSKVYAAIRVSFALGYTCGQILDAQDAETGLILKALREKKALLYLPHKKSAAAEREMVNNYIIKNRKKILK
jgi:hypothetical protein